MKHTAKNQMGYLLWLPQKLDDMLCITNSFLYWPLLQNKNIRIDWVGELPDYAYSFTLNHTSLKEVLNTKHSKYDCIVLFGIEQENIIDNLDQISNSLSSNGRLFIGVECLIDDLLNKKSLKMIIKNIIQRRCHIKKIKSWLNLRKPDNTIIRPLPSLWRPIWLVSADPNFEICYKSTTHINHNIFLKLMLYLCNWYKYFPISASLWIVSNNESTNN